MARRPRYGGVGLLSQSKITENPMREHKNRPSSSRRDNGKPRFGRDANGRKEGRHKGGGHRPKGGGSFARPRRGAGEETVVIYGWHSGKAALENPAREIRRVMATENAAKRLAEEQVRTRVTPEIVRPEAIARLLSADAVHNGLWIEAEPLASPDVEDLAPEGVALVLDQITDPHNVGAILRSAAAFGATALITTARHSPEATGVLAKAASGALEYVPIVTVQNLARGLAALKARGFLTVGLDSEGDSDLAALPVRAPLALVLGAEGKGLRQLTRETCDHVARLDLPGEIKSLNVSNAAALSLYIASTRLR
jgi:23S rRNA (guanosine2251-2'-O)-methyltransferase